MKLHDPNRTEPCQHMENFLQHEADGTARGLAKWYAVSHAARCAPCGSFLQTLRRNIGLLRSARSAETDQEAITRLQQGDWRQP